VIKLLKIQILPVEAINFFYKLFSDVFEYREEHNVVRNDLTQTLMQARKELVLKENSTGEGIIVKFRMIIEVFKAQQLTILHYFDWSKDRKPTLIAV